MAISDEIQRLQSAKAALKTAINAKNDSSHQIDDETLDDYAGFVDLIHDALPAAYTELEYIESSGTQYIDTGVVPTVANGTEIYLKMAYAATTTYNSTGANNNLNASILSGKWRFNAVVTSVPAVIDEVVEFVLKQTSSGRYYAINNESGYGTSKADNNNFCLGMLGGVSTYTIAAKFYKCTIKENDTIIKNLIPAKRNSDNAIGMYDKVSGTFFTNAGTGEFIAPPNSGGGSATLVTKTITENGTYDATDDSADGYSEVTVNVQPPQEAPSKDVNFYDYDGKILYSYTAAEFQNLTELPANPTHSGLTSKGWNWTLADAKAQVTAMGTCNIGQLYLTSDEKTRFYCHFEGAAKSFYLGICPNGTVTIDWGDNSSTDTLTGTSISTSKTIQHTYAQDGDYVISLSPSSNTTFNINGATNTTYLLRGAVNTTANIHKPYNACLKKVELGKGVRVGDFAFNFCVNLESITMPTDGVIADQRNFYNCRRLRHINLPSPTTGVKQYMFYNANLETISIPKTAVSFGADMFYNSALSFVSIPKDATALPNDAFLGCTPLTGVVMPSGLTSVGNRAFYGCTGLTKLEFPSTLTSIGTQAFQGCYGMKEYHFKSTTPPTLDNTDAFANMQSDCVIYVPSAKLNDYKTASNWSTYASQMVGE